MLYNLAFFALLAAQGHCTQGKYCMPLATSTSQAQNQLIPLIKTSVQARLGTVAPSVSKAPPANTKIPGTRNV